jgi:pyridoxine kinase
MMLSGYIPGAEAVVAVGEIAKELRERNKDTPGSFFWVLDPVMGDNGKIYVAEDVVPAYKGLIQYADLILPNQFEAEYAFRASNTPFDRFHAPDIANNVSPDCSQKSRLSTWNLSTQPSKLSTTSTAFPTSSSHLSTSHHQDNHLHTCPSSDQA